MRREDAPSQRGAESPVVLSRLTPSVGVESQPLHSGVRSCLLGKWPGPSGPHPFGKVWRVCRPLREPRGAPGTDPLLWEWQPRPLLVWLWE